MELAEERLNEESDFVVVVVMVIEDDKEVEQKFVLRELIQLSENPTFKFRMRDLRLDPNGERGLVNVSALSPVN